MALNNGDMETIQIVSIDIYQKNGINGCNAKCVMNGKNWDYGLASKYPITREYVEQDIQRRAANGEPEKSFTVEWLV